MRICLLIFSLLMSAFISAQTTLPIDSTLSWYEAERMPEKMHIHFDKPVYSPGQTIFFKTYLLSGTEYTNNSNNLYIDFIGEDGKILQQTQWPIFESSAHGNFTIPKDFAGEVLQVKAYTRWMLNFDSAFLYIKNIPLAPTRNNTDTKKDFEPISTMRFFPEGGYMINGLTTKVAYAVRNQSGYPVNASGFIISSSNDTICELKTVHDGMGSFFFLPEAAKQYYAVWQDEFGSRKKTELPDILKDGISLQLKWYNKKLFFAVESTIEQTQKITLRITMHQQIVYKTSLQVALNKRKQGNIITDSLTSGIILVTLFNEKEQPFAERAVFINNQNYLLAANIIATQTNNTARGENNWEITVPDSIPAQFSIAVTDESISGDEENNIVSQLLLGSELRGYIHNPAYYFSSNADSTREHLDLLLLTHGWRKINWQSMAMGYKPLPNYPKEKTYLSIYGQILGGDEADYRAVKNISLILLEKDSSIQKISLPIYWSGDFLKDTVMFYDTVKVFFQYTRYKGLADKTVLYLTNGLLKREVSFSPQHNHLRRTTNSFAKAAFFSKQEEEQAGYRQSISEENIIAPINNKSHKDFLYNKYNSALFRNKGGQFLDISNETFANQNMFQFLQGKVAGLQVGQTGNINTLTWGGGTTAVFLNEKQVTADVLNAIPFTDIAFIKAFHPPFYHAPMGGLGGAIAVYTKRRSEVEDIASITKGYSFTYIKGYTPLKEFYSPDYANTQPNSMLKDVRSTLYWDATKRTDRFNNKVLIHFYNNDISKSYRVIIEGMNELGKLLRYEKVISQ